MRTLPSNFLEGPSTSTDNALARWDGTDGTRLQDASGWTVSDLNAMTGTALTLSGTLTADAVSVTGSLLEFTAAAVLDMGVTGNRIDFDTDNDTSIRADADDSITIEVGTFDIFTFDILGLTSLSTLGDIRLDGVGVLHLDDDADTHIASTSDDNLIITVGASNRFQITNTAVTVALETVFSSTDNIQIPAGTTAQRPGTPAQGDVRYNSTLGRWEGYDGAAWGALAQRMFSRSFGDFTGRAGTAYLRTLGHSFASANKGYVLTAAGELRAQGVNVNITTAVASGVVTFSVYVNGVQDTTLDVAVDASSTGWKNTSTRVAVGSGITIAANDRIAVQAIETLGPIAWDDSTSDVEGEYVEDW